MQDTPNRDEELFTKALGLPTGERTVFLEQACEGDEAMLRRLRALLGAHDQAGGFLEQSAQRRATRARVGIQVGEKPGDRIGHFKLLQQIGEERGGMLFMAE